MTGKLRGCCLDTRCHAQCCAPDLREFHAPQPPPDTLESYPVTLRKSPLYLVCTANVNFFLESTFAPICPTPSGTFLALPGLRGLSASSSVFFVQLSVTRLLSLAR